jgi:hypothetical protein
MPLKKTWRKMSTKVCKHGLVSILLLIIINITIITTIVSRDIHHSST